MLQPHSTGASGCEARGGGAVDFLAEVLQRVTPVLLMATTNEGKLREIKVLLEGLAIDLATLEGRPPIEPPEETGRTFAENARLKARYY